MTQFYGLALLIALPVLILAYSPHLTDLTAGALEGSARILLIAELFVADELEVRRASMLPDPNEGESAYITDAEDVLNTIRAALAKARGEKPC